jgi:DNA-binding GntR family transcriptional regulator
VASQQLLADAPPTEAEPVYATPIEHADLNRKVYDQLRAAVLSGELAANQRLNLTTLSSQLGVSRSPVHQALTRLAAEGLVEVRSRRGYKVTPITRTAIVEEYDVRLALELLAAERTVGRLSAEQLARFRAALDDTLEPMDGDGPWDLHGFIRSNQAYHHLQLQFAGNRALLEVYANLRVSLLMERVLGAGPFATNDALRDDLIAQHTALWEAYEREDLPGAQLVIREHLKLGERMAVEAIEAAGGEL